MNNDAVHARNNTVLLLCRGPQTLRVATRLGLNISAWGLSQREQSPTTKFFTAYTRFCSLPVQILHALLAVRFICKVISACHGYKRFLKTWRDEFELLQFAFTHAHVLIRIKIAVLDFSNKKHISTETSDFLALVQPDFIVTAGFPIISAHVISAAKVAALNVHNGILPECAGCNGFHAAVLQGHSSFGVSVHELSERIDDESRIVAEDRSVVSFSVPVEYICCSQIHELLVIRGLSLAYKVFDAYASGKVSYVDTKHRKRKVLTTKSLSRNDHIAFMHFQNRLKWLTGK
mmetsp:Transcript_18196/g.61857  ORF Transcript_18196/g.61857 Transcript_18196/m.61857 type:complete len:290 (-) Transcript_18196:92-961(-)